MNSILTVWRGEISDELEHAQGQLRDARHEFAAAFETARDERRALNELMLILADHDATTPLASAIQRKIGDMQHQVRNAVGAATRAENAVTALVTRIGDLEQARQQLDALEPQPVAEPAA